VPRTVASAWREAGTFDPQTPQVFAFDNQWYRLVLCEKGLRRLRMHGLATLSEVSLDNTKLLARDAGMKLLRAGGTMLNESDAFYDWRMNTDAWPGKILICEIPLSDGCGLRGQFPALSRTIPVAHSALRLAFNAVTVTPTSKGPCLACRSKTLVVRGRDRLAVAGPAAGCEPGCI
jgi:hypothetical protein